MNREKLFCYECRNYVEYDIEESNIEAILKGEKYYYNGQTAYCAECGAEIYVPEINDSNLAQLYSIYEKENKHT